ncbi:unnamed protein product [Nesidiocoris tenuis]|uniref:Uncharacterized protein n=1 Tax=Nesidiocoris tenuis TaxID=355587 RepID=A0A6H5GBB3_9HEMI|nr:unnamed protein product [Nesidiocoris tenuis]
MFFRLETYHLLSVALCISAALGQDILYDYSGEIFEFQSEEPTELPEARSTTTTTASSPTRRGMSTFQLEFWSFEKRMKSFIDTIRRNQLATLSSNVHFREEIHEYVSRLQNQVPRNTTVKYRDVCDCDGRATVRPCPEKCLYSCALYDQWGQREYQNDCRSINTESYYSCRCHRDSGMSCHNDIEKNCIEEKIVSTNEEVCSEYALDEEKILRSYNLFANLIVEPLRMFYRGVESRLTLLQQSAASVDHLSSIATLVCSNQSDAICTEETPNLLRTEMQNVRILKKNITIEMIKAQDEIAAIAKSVDYLREQTIAQVVRSTKEFACCLKTLNFTVEGYDCNPPPTGKDRFFLP